MTVMNPELNAVRDFYIDRLKNSVDSVQAGDDNTPPTTGDTSIGNLLETLTLENTDVSTTGTIQWRAKAGILSFIGSTVRECTTFDSSDTTIKTRNLTVEDVKGGDEIFWFSPQTSITVKNN